MTQSNMSGPFNLTNGLIVGGTTHLVGAVTIDGAITGTGGAVTGKSLVWASGTAAQYTGLTTVGNVTAGTSVIWPVGTAGQWAGLTTLGNLTAGTSVIWPAGTLSTNIIGTGGVTTQTGIVTFGTTRMITGTFPVSGVVGASNMGDFLFNNRPVSGSATHWVCTAPGTPGTWLACGSAS